VADDDPDLIDLLDADHHGLLDSLTDDNYVSNVVKHLAAERTLLYPEVERYLSDVGADQLDALREIDRRLEISGSEPSELRLQVLREHIEAQRLLFGRMRTEVPAGTLTNLAAKLPSVLASAPTHAHPHLPDHGPLREVTSELAAVVDDIEDSIKRRGHYRGE
jgi:hypothetical protein